MYPKSSFASKKGFKASMKLKPNAEPLERWHMDWYEIKSTNILKVVDAGFSWIEAFASGKRTADVVIKFLQTVF